MHIKKIKNQNNQSLKKSAMKDSAVKFKLQFLIQSDLNLQLPSIPWMHFQLMNFFLRNVIYL